MHTWAGGILAAVRAAEATFSGTITPGHAAGCCCRVMRLPAKASAVTGSMQLQVGRHPRGWPHTAAAASTVAARARVRQGSS